MKEVEINVSSTIFPSQFVPDSVKETEEYGLQIGQAIQYEWFRRDAARANYSRCRTGRSGNAFSRPLFRRTDLPRPGRSFDRPRHMGERPICAMHGYHPSEKHSYAVLCTNQAEIPEEIESIPDIYQLMMRDADLAKARNAAVANVLPT